MFNLRFNLRFKQGFFLNLANTSQTPVLSDTLPSKVHDICILKTDFQPTFNKLSCHTPEMGEYQQYSSRLHYQPAQKLCQVLGHRFVTTVHSPLNNCLCRCLYHGCAYAQGHEALTDTANIAKTKQDYTTCLAVAVGLWVTLEVPSCSVALDSTKILLR